MRNDSLFLRAYVFLVGFGWQLEVGIIGRFSLSEILMYLALPFLFAQNRTRIWNGTAVKAFGLLALFAVAVIVSDLINDNYFQFFIRGLARPIAIGLNSLFFVLILVRSPRVLLFFFYGILPGACAGYFQESAFVMVGEAGGYVFFNAKIEPIVRSAAIILGLLLYRYSRLLSAFWFIFPMIVVALFGSRSGAISYLLTAFTLGYLWFLKGGGREKLTLTLPFMLRTGSILLIGLTCVYGLYVYAAPRGIIGEKQQQKFYDQSATRFGASPLGLVAAGRTAVVAGLLAGLDNPVWGLGSWPNIGEYFVEAVDIAGEEINQQEYQYFFTQRAAGHSIIIGSWYNNGILPFSYWLFFLLVMVRGFLFFLSRDNILTPAIVFFFYDLMWALWFSPLNLNGRLWVALFTGIAICFIDRRGPLVSEREFALLSPFSKAFQKRGFFRG